MLILKIIITSFSITCKQKKLKICLIKPEIYKQTPSYHSFLLTKFGSKSIKQAISAILNSPWSPRVIKRFSMELVFSRRFFRKFSGVSFLVIGKFNFTGLILGFIYDNWLVIILQNTRWYSCFIVKETGSRLINFPIINWSISLGEQKACTTPSWSITTVWGIKWW